MYVSDNLAVIAFQVGNYKKGQLTAQLVSCRKGSMITSQLVSHHKGSMNCTAGFLTQRVNELRIWFLTTKGQWTAQLVSHHKGSMNFTAGFYSQRVSELHSWFLVTKGQWTSQWISRHKGSMNFTAGFLDHNFIYSSIEGEKIFSWIFHYCPFTVFYDSDFFNPIWKNLFVRRRLPLHFWFPSDFKIYYLDSILSRFIFFVYRHTNLHGLFNAKATLVEEQLCYCLTHSQGNNGVHASLKDISQ